MYIDIDISEEQYQEFNLYCTINKINPEEFLKNYILSILSSSLVHSQKQDQYIKNSWEEFVTLSDYIGAEGSRKCKKCGRVNTHRLNSTCDGEWEDI